MGFSTSRRNAMLNSLPASVYVQGHSGDPGESGTANVLAGNARVKVDLSPAGNGIRLPVAGTYELDTQPGQTIAWVSYWSAPTGGTFEGADQLDQAETYSGQGKYRLTAQAFTILG